MDGYMEADLYNLQPAIGEVNRLRLNDSMALIPGEARECPQPQPCGAGTPIFPLAGSMKLIVGARGALTCYGVS